MQLKNIERFRLIDRNKAGGDAVFQYNGQEVKAEFVFYLQGDSCLSIRLGRHDQAMGTAELEEFIQNNRHDLKKLVKPEVARVREEQRARRFAGQ